MQAHAHSRFVFEEKTLRIPGVHSLGKYNYTAAASNLPLHRHPNCIEIGLLVKGQQFYQIGGRVYCVKGGEQFVSFHDEIHGTGYEPQEKGILYWLILDVSELPKKFLFLDPHTAEQLIKTLQDLPSHHFASNPESRSTLDKAFRALLQVRTPDECTGVFEHERPTHACLENGQGLTEKQSEFSSHLLEAVSHITSFILQTIHASHANVSRISPPIQRSVNFIDKNKGRDFDVRDIADAAHLPTLYFKARFRKEVGLPLAQYILRQKIEIAKERLAKSDATIGDVAKDLGFLTSQYFATVFKRFTNRTPSEFLKVQNGPYDLIFDGDSTTSDWLESGRRIWQQHYGMLRALNLGVGGDQVQHLIWRVQNGSLEGQNPKLIVVQIGADNMGQEPKEVAVSMKILLEEYKNHCPQAHILLLGIFPSDSSPTSESRQWVAKVNEVISTYGDDRVTYMDIGPEFLRPDGTISSDVLDEKKFFHPTATGYGIWANAIQPIVDKYVGMPMLK